MARISKPQLKLEYLYQKATGDKENYGIISRTYYRNEDKKFIPYGWVVETKLGLFTFTDEEVENLTWSEVLESK